MSLFGVFLVRILQYLDWIRRDTSYIYVFSPNAGKNGPEKLGTWTFFEQCSLSWKRFCFQQSVSWKIGKLDTKKFFPFLLTSYNILPLSNFTGTYAWNGCLFYSFLILYVSKIIKYRSASIGGGSHSINSWTLKYCCNYVQKS